MGRYTPAARLWIVLVALAAVTLVVRTFPSATPSVSDWLVLALLAVCAAAAHHFPIRSADNSAVFAMTNVLLIAGALILPPGLVGLLPVLALTTQSLLRRHVAGESVRWLFNTAQTTLAALAAASIVEWAGGRSLHDPRSLALGLVAGALFVMAQATLVGIVIALNSRIPLAQAATFSRPALLGEGTKAVLAVAVASLWLADPALLLLVPLLLAVAHQLTRTAHLAHLAEIDPKTGLYNARHFEQALEEELAHSRRLNRPLALLFADLDHFKRINDRHGHDTGDRVLRVVATLLRAQLRKGDMVARFGGEEFVILLPGTDAEQALYLAERLRFVLQDHPFELTEGGELHCTMSVGVALCPEDGTDAPTLLRRADAAMYRAKVTRNAVARSEDAPRPRARRAADQHLTLPPTGGRPRPAQALLWGTSLAGLLTAAWSLWALTQHGSWERLLPLLALAMLAELLPVRIYEARRQSVSFSMSAAVSLAAAAMEPASAALVGLAAALAHATTTRQRAPDKMLFGLGNMVMAAALAGWAYGLLRPAQAGFDFGHLAAALGAVLAYVGANAGLVALMVSLRSGRPLRSVLFESGWFVPTNVLLGLTGAFVGSVQEQLGPFGAAMFAVPVLLMRFTLEFYARRSQAVIRTLEHQAQHDPLTDLANRYLLQERLQEMLEAPGEQRVALLLLDVDRFQEINDTFGHEAGDLLLRQVGPRLRAAVRDTDMIARLGGDEFAILLPIGGALDSGRLADTIVRKLAEPFVVGSYALEVGASLGLAFAPEHGRDAATLLRHADVALSVAKRKHSGWAIYRPEQDEHSPQRLALVGELRRAIERDELTLYYQPKVAHPSKQVTSVEALLRWPHPERGLVPPDQFIPLAEHTGLIRPLTRWVLDTALRQCRAWLAIGRVLPVAVNVSVQDLHDEGFPDTVAQLLEAHGVPAGCLRLEITEGAMMADPERVLGVLARVRDLGVGVSVDDFGTGYASLAYLKRLPVDELKIDRSFIRSLTTDRADAAIVQSTIALGHALGLAVVAEGVEDQATWELLGQFGCDLVQGYFVSRPLSAADLARWLDPIYEELPRAA